MFRIEEKTGLTSVALGRDGLEDALVPISLATATQSDNQPTGATQGSLEVLPVGPPPPNPAEFVASHVLGSILAELDARAEIVLIDAPPLLNLSDAITLTSRVDGLVVVTRLSVIKRSTLQELRRVLDASPIAKLGFVATGASSDKDAYGGYGYGYGSSNGQSAAGWQAAREGAAD
jgi:Mrp family chromosome partitioning ATPase